MSPLGAFTSRRGRCLSSTHPARARTPALALVLASVLLLGACGSSGSKRTEPTVPSNATTGRPSADATATTGGSTTASTSSPAATAGTLPADTIIISSSTTSLGEVLVDSTGHTIYVFLGDTSTTATCVGDCAKTWPPILGNQVGLAAAISYQAGEFKVVSQPGGTKQLIVNGRPAYTYKGDRIATETNGQGQGGQWFALGADGQPITKKS
jgi:predicted lipoprotein with Yx(FWY)xxD motif